MKKTCKGLAICIPFMLLFMSFDSQAQEQRESWISKSSLIFKAEVVLLQTSTINWSDPSTLGVVRLQEIFKGEQELSAFMNELVTVNFNDLKTVKKGQTILVYANMWIANDGIAVTEIAHEVIGDNKLTPDNYRSEIKESLQKADILDLKSRASKAELVVAGTILSVRKAPASKTFETEHNPEWILADIKIDESIKGGQAGGSTLTIAFPGSQDFMWYRSPRFKEGDKAILFLSRENFGYQDVKHFTITTAEQVSDIRELDKVRQALK